MDTVEVTVSFPRSILAAARVPESELDGLIRESVVLELYREARISLGKAAELMGVPTKFDMMAVLAKHNMWLNYTADDAMRDWDTLREVMASAGGER